MTTDYGPGHLLYTPTLRLRIFYDTNTTANPAYGSTNTFNIKVTVLCRGDGSADTAGFIRLNGNAGTTDSRTPPNCSGHYDDTFSYTLSIPKSELEQNTGLYTSRYKYAELVVSDNTQIMLGIRTQAMNGGGIVTFEEVPRVFYNQSYGTISNFSSYPAQQGNAKGDLKTAFALWQYNNYSCSGTSCGGVTNTSPYSLFFKADCTFENMGSISTFLRWYDADDGESNQENTAVGGDGLPGISWELIDTSNGNVVSSAASLGGNDVYKEKLININPNHVYKWEWFNVSPYNGIQLWMPFSEFNTGVQCPDWSLNPSSQIKGGNLASYSSGPAKVPDTATTVTFRHEIVNDSNSSNAATFQWRVEGCYLAAGGTCTASDFSASANGGNAVVSNGSTGCYSTGDTLPVNCSESGVAPGGNGRTPITFDYHIKIGALPGAKYCQRIAYDSDNGPNTTPNFGAHSTPVCVILSSSGSCDSITTTPSLLEPNTPNSHFDANFSWSAAPPAGSTIKVTINGVTYSGTTSGTKSDTVSANLTSPGAGDYTATWSLSNPALVSDPDTVCTLSVRTLPYFKVFGADISAGGDFDCNGDTTHAGVIGGWYNNGSPINGLSPINGAGAQFGATALGEIIGAGSAQGSSPPTGLTFANDANIDGPSNVYSASLGGHFGGGHCLYSQPLPSNAAQDIGASLSGVLPNGNHELASGGLTIDSGAVASGSHVGIYAHGDVYIKGSGITYQNSGGWATTDDIPTFLLSTDGGNIYIDRSVTTLDGIYIANGGNIYTCAKGMGVLYNLDELWANCNLQLTVHGAFIADRVNLMRSLGSLKDATLDGASHGCTTGGSQKVCAGEVFDFSPEMYLGNWDFSGSGTGNNKLDAISALPPVL